MIAQNLRARLALFLVVLLLFPVLVQAAMQAWRSATEKELAAAIPDRAPVEKERIETELRTASGVTDGKGRYIAGVVMITAGYSAEGKYSHFVIVQAPIKIGEMKLLPGHYVFGYKRVDDETLDVKFYEAATGKPLGSVPAKIEKRSGPIRSLLITPPSSGRSIFQIGRFVFEYSFVPHGKT
jgi:hypothetical protein